MISKDDSDYYMVIVTRSDDTEFLDIIMTPTGGDLATFAWVKHHFGKVKQIRYEGSPVLNPMMVKA